MGNDFLLVSKDTLECPVCLETSIESFCIFPCGHSVCHSCSVMIANQLKATWTGRKFYECPICRQQVSPKKIQIPPRNFVIQNLLDSATNVVPTDLSSWENMTKKEKEQLVSRIAEQQDRLEQLEIANAELWTRRNELLWATLFAFILAIIFMTTLIYVTTGARGDIVLTCEKPVPTESKTMWQRILVCLQLRDATDRMDELILKSLVIISIDFGIVLLWFSNQL